MATVRLVAYTKPVVGEDPRRLAVLAVKVSAGNLHKRDWIHYLTLYPEEHVGEHIVKASRYPVVLEHIVFTFLVEDISRVASHQLVRHRIASYTQESQRYSESYMKQVIECLNIIGASNAEKAFEIFKEKPKDVLHCIEKGFVVPPQIMSNSQALQTFTEEILRAIYSYYKLLNQGISLEDARFAIPQASKTRLLVTLNLRELLHIACLRLKPEAQWEIREIVEKMLAEASKIVPEATELLKLTCSDTK
ncbi:MAG: FAD-dependent thymidylate synthase [Ignisphaera sp.]